VLPFDTPLACFGLARVTEPSVTRARDHDTVGDRRSDEVCVPAKSPLCRAERHHRMVL
jgi:hypothetical protein